MEPSISSSYIKIGSLTEESVDSSPKPAKKTQRRFSFFKTKTNKGNLDEVTKSIERTLNDLKPNNEKKFKKDPDQLNFYLNQIKELNKISERIEKWEKKNNKEFSLDLILDTNDSKDQKKHPHDWQELATNYKSQYQNLFFKILIEKGYKFK